MKTLEEKLLEMKEGFDLVGVKLNGLTWQRIEKNMKEYATEYAKESLKNASEKAIFDTRGSVYDWEVDKHSIISENNLPKHR